MQLLKVHLSLKSLAIYSHSSSVFGTYVYKHKMIIYIVYFLKLHTQEDVGKDDSSVTVWDEDEGEVPIVLGTSTKQRSKKTKQ